MSDSDLDAGETLTATGGTCPAGKKAAGGAFAITTASAGDRSDVVVYESKLTPLETAWTVSIIADDNNNNVVAFQVGSVCLNS